jgi:hypothetical protein
MSKSPGTSAIIAAAERLLPGGQVELVGGRTWLASVATSDGRYSVRQLDPTLPAIRVELIHEFLAQPELRHATPLVAQDRVGSLAFDARAWAEGTPSGRSFVEGEWRALHLPANISLDRLGSMAASLGAFHRTGSNGSILARLPDYKLKETLTAARRSLDLDERRLASEIRKESRARRWLSAARPLLTHAEQALEQTGFLREEPAVIAHLDLWGSHIVFTDDESASFLDCSTIGAAPAAVDLAQLIARSGVWSDERVERALQRYADELPISPLQRRVLPWLIALDAIPACGRLLVRAEDERNPLSDSDCRTVWAAADLQLELLASLASRFVPAPPRKNRYNVRRQSRENG